MIPAGKRNAYLTLERSPAVTQNADGLTISPVGTAWIEVFNAWGAIESPDSSAREMWAGYVMNATLTHVLKIPYTTGILVTDRFAYKTTAGTRRFNVAGPPINPDERNIELHIPVSEKFDP